MDRQTELEKTIRVAAAELLAIYAKKMETCEEMYSNAKTDNEREILYTKVKDLKEYMLALTDKIIVSDTK